MSHFAAFFSLEWRRFFRKRNIIILFIIWALLAAFTIVGINEYRDLVDREQQFQDIEALNFKKFPNYDIYGDEGISVQYCPGSTSIFFRNIGLSTELIGKFDSIVNIGIFDNYKSKVLFRGMFAGIWSFAGIIFVFVSLICLFWAAELLGNKEYLKFLCSFISRIKVYLFLVVSRLILLTLFLIFIFLSIYILLMLSNVLLTSTDLINLTGYFWTTLLMLFFFFLCGLVIGIIRSKTGGVLAIMLVWIVFIFLVPGFIHYLVEKNTFGSIKDYQTEIRKFNIITDFEKRADEEFGSKYNSNNMALARQIMEKYYNKDYKKIEILENKLRSEICANVNTLKNLFLLTPANIYYITGIEISSRGYKNFMDFYKYLQQMKSKFVRFYIDRFYYHDPQKMVSFIKEKENLYFVKCRLPDNFSTGILINLLYILVMLFLSYICFKWSLHKIDEKDIERFLVQDLTFNKGEVKVMEVENENFKNLLYNLLSGKFKRKSLRQFKGKVILDGEDFVSKTKKPDLIYVPNPGVLPGDIKVKDFVKLITALNNLTDEEKEAVQNDHCVKMLRKKKFKNLDNHKRGMILLNLAIIKKSPIYFFFDTALGLTADFAILFKEKMETLKKNAIVLYLTTNDQVRTTRVEKGKPFLENPKWLDQLDYVKSLKE